MRRRGNCALVVLLVAADTIKNLAPATEWGSRGYLIATSKGVGDMASDLYRLSCLDI